MGVRRHREDDRQGGGAVRPVRVGALRHAGAAPRLPLRRDGESPHDLSDADAFGGGPVAGRRGGARAGALVDREPGDQLDHGAFLAQRGDHGLRRAPHPGGAERRGGRGPVVGDRADRARPGDGALRPVVPPDLPADEARRDRPRRRLLVDPVREGGAALGAGRADRRARALRHGPASTSQRSASPPSPPTTGCASSTRSCLG